MKNKIIIMLVALFVTVMMVGCEDAEDIAREEAKIEEAEEKAKEEEKAEAEEEAKVKKEEDERKAEAAAKKEADAQKKAQADAVAQEFLEASAVDILEENFGDGMLIIVDSEEKIFQMTPVTPAFTTELVMIVDGKSSREPWDGLVESMASMSKSFSELLGEGYDIVLMNPLNSDNFIIHVADGEVIYNALAE